jgi:hypothetical protein
MGLSIELAPYGCLKPHATKGSSDRSPSDADSLRADGKRFFQGPPKVPHDIRRRIRGLWSLHLLEDLKANRNAVGALGPALFFFKNPKDVV